MHLGLKKLDWWTHGRLWLDCFSTNPSFSLRSQNYQKAVESPQQFYNFVEIPQQHDSTSITQNELRSTTIRHLTWSAEMVAGLSTASGSDTAWTAVLAYSDSPSHSQVETSSNTQRTDKSKADSRTVPPSRIVTGTPNLAALLTHRGQLIRRKISKFNASRCKILRLKCTKFDFRWGFTPEPAGGP